MIQRYTITYRAYDLRRNETITKQCVCDGVSEQAVLNKIDELEEQENAYSFEVHYSPSNE